MALEGIYWTAMKQPRASTASKGGYALEFFTALVLVGMVLRAAATAGMPASAAEPPEIDLALGKDINETCAGCHGEYGQGSIDGEYPRLAGLSATYIARQLRLFKQRERINIPMLPYTNERELPEEDLLAIAGYLSSIQLPVKMPPVADAADFDALERLNLAKRVVNIAPYPGDVAAGGRVYAKECASCHGRDGYGDAAHDVPQLAGQYSLYLSRQVENIRRGERLHDDPDDAELFRQYTDTEINDILAYLATLDDE